MRKCVFRELDLGTTHLHNQVVGCAGAFRYQVTGEVGEEDKLVLEGCGVVIGLLQEFLGTGLDGGNLRLCGFGLFLLSFLHELADSCRGLLLLAQEGVGLLLESLAFIVHSYDVHHNLTGVEMLFCEFPDYKLRIVMESFECKHIFQ